MAATLVTVPHLRDEVAAVLGNDSGIEIVSGRDAFYQHLHQADAMMAELLAEEEAEQAKEQARSKKSKKKKKAGQVASGGEASTAPPAAQPDSPPAASATPPPPSSPTAALDCADEPHRNPHKTRNVPSPTPRACTGGRFRHQPAPNAKQSARTQ